MTKKTKLCVIKYGTEDYMVSFTAAYKSMGKYISELEKEFPDTKFILVPFYININTMDLKQMKVLHTW